MGLLQGEAVPLKETEFIVTLKAFSPCYNRGDLLGPWEIADPNHRFWNRVRVAVIMEDTWDETGVAVGELKSFSYLGPLRNRIGKQMGVP